MKSLKESITDASAIWSEFETLEAEQTRRGISEDTDKAYRFFEGNQWQGLESGGEDLPVYNFIAPIIRYKTAMIAMNNISMSFSAPISTPHMQHVCAALSKLCAQTWERLKMDSVCWDAVKAALISGDSYIYFYDGDGKNQLIDRTDIFFADEALPDITKQQFIIIREERNVNDIRKEAEQNGISKEITMTILPDNEDSDNCTSLLRMWLDNGDLHFCRAVKTAVYQPEQVIKGLDRYPIAALVSERARGSIRGRGEVLSLIPNQIEINRNLARRILNAKITAYSRLVYSSDRIVNPKALTEVGTAIEVDGGGVSSIRDAVSYLTPSSMSPDAKNLSDELLAVTKELSGAGDAALGNIDPTQASGSAIIAVRDQAALPLNEQTAKFRQFAEDIACIWLKLWAVYNPDYLELPDGITISGRELTENEPQIRVDISNATPFSKYAREQALERLFTSGHITFEEYVSALDDDSAAPRAKLEQIIKNRGGMTDVNNQN